MTSSSQATTIATGVFLVLLVAISHVSCSQLTSDLLNKKGFQSVIFVQSFNFSFTGLYLIVPLLRPQQCKQALVVTCMSTPVQFLKYSFFFFIITLMANMCYIFALEFVFPSTAGAIMASNPAYIYVLSLVVIPSTRLTLMNSAAVVLAMAGDLMIVLQHTQSGEQQLVQGVVLLCCSCLFAAIFQVFFKKWLYNLSAYGLTCMLGLHGVFSLLLEMTTSVVLSQVGVQPIDWHIIHDNALQMVLMGISSTVFSTCMNLGILLTSPLFIAIGLMLDSPVNILYDYFVNDHSISPLQISGTFLILIGFSLLVVSFSREIPKEEGEREEREEREREREREREEVLLDGNTDY